MAVKNSRRAQQVIQSVASLFTGRFSQHLMPARPSPINPDNVNAVPTGFRPLDKALGLGGLPGGYITELIASGTAMDSSGANCIAARIAAKAQRQQRVVTLVDFSHSFDPWLAERSGLMAPQLLLIQPDTLFNALTSLEAAPREEGLVVVIMGVVSELLEHVEEHLRKVLLRRLRTIVRQSNSAFIFVTSPLENDPFNPANYPAGFQLAELADIRLWIQEENWSYKDGLTIAYKANLAVIKNELALAGTGADIRIKFSGV